MYIGDDSANVDAEQSVDQQKSIEIRMFVVIASWLPCYACTGPGIWASRSGKV